MKTIRLPLLVLLFATLGLVVGCSTPKSLATKDLPATTATGKYVAASIASRYDAAWPDLPPDKQRHYAQRLYRMTGKARYLPANQTYAQRLLSELRQVIQSADISAYVDQQARKMLANYPQRTKRQQQRQRMLAQWGPIIYAQNLAFKLLQLQSYGLLTAAQLPGHERIFDYLQTTDFRTFMLDTHVLGIYAAQVANLVYYLHELDVVDWRADVIRAFRQKYPPQDDFLLTDAEYSNKIYGMTHFVIAASNYYQRPVSASEFAWVLDAFAASQEAIIQRTKPDVYAEVGISFLLAGQRRHPTLARMQQAIVQAWDPVFGIIPSEEGSFALASGEHRNVLAIMLLTWPDQLHPGPKLQNCNIRLSQQRT